MKILICNSAGMSAHYWFNLGLSRAFQALGHEALIWDNSKVSEFDAFDKFEPDIFIGQTYCVNEALIKCIKQRPFTKVILKASDYGYLSDKTRKDSPIVRVTEEELRKVDELRFSGLFSNLKLHIHYHPDYLNFTHDGWGREGYDVYSIMNAADTFEYLGSEYKKEYDCDIGFVGNFWSYKAETLNTYLYPLCYGNKYKVKICGNSHHPVPQYIGSLPFGSEKNFYKSCRINFSMSEPHSREFGYDVIEKPFKIACSKGFFVSDYVDGLNKLFSEDIVMVKDPSEVKETVDFFLENESERKKHVESMYNNVIESHTYLDRAAQILDIFEIEHKLKEVKLEHINNWV